MHSNTLVGVSSKNYNFLAYDYNVFTGSLMLSCRYHFYIQMGKRTNRFAICSHTRKVQYFSLVMNVGKDRILYN